MHYIQPEQQHIEAFLNSYPADQPVVMLNLLKFKPQAEYQPEDNAEPCSGAEAFGRYGAGVNPLMEARGAAPIWQGRPSGMLIGPQDKDWHLAILVRYPSAQAFIDMVSSDEYRAISCHRTAALADSRLIAHQEL